MEAYYGAKDSPGDDAGSAAGYKAAHEKAKESDPNYEEMTVGSYIRNEGKGRSSKVYYIQNPSTTVYTELFKKAISK